MTHGEWRWSLLEVPFHNISRVFWVDPNYALWIVTAHILKTLNNYTSRHECVKLSEIKMNHNSIRNELVWLKIIGLGTHGLYIMIACFHKRLAWQLWKFVHWLKYDSQIALSAVPDYGPLSQMWCTWYFMSCKSATQYSVVHSIVQCIERQPPHHLPILILGAAIRL